MFTEIALLLWQSLLFLFLLHWCLVIFCRLEHLLKFPRCNAACGLNIVCWFFFKYPNKYVVCGYLVCPTNILVFHVQEEIAVAAITELQGTNHSVHLFTHMQHMSLAFFSSLSAVQHLLWATSHIKIWHLPGAHLDHLHSSFLWYLLCSICGYIHAQYIILLLYDGQVRNQKPCFFSRLYC